MYVGKMLFAQLMDFLPWKTFHRQKASAIEALALHFATDPIGRHLRKNAARSGPCRGAVQTLYFANNQPVGIVQLLTGQQCPLL